MDPHWQHSLNARFLSDAGGTFVEQNPYNPSASVSSQAPGSQFEPGDAQSGASEYDHSLDVQEWPWSSYEGDYDAQAFPGAASSGDEYNPQLAAASNDKSDLSKKRREQNRRAQKAFRQRKQEEVEVLKDRLAENEERFSLLQNLHHELIDAYEDLLARYQGAIGASPNTASVGNSNDPSPARDPANPQNVVSEVEFSNFMKGPDRAQPHQRYH